VALGTLVSLIQAFVFTLLSMIYISLAIAHEDDH
jgi:F0F1-type ATP synthase membrane subunit a